MIALGCGLPVAPAGFGGASTCHGREASASRGSIEDSSTILTCFAHDSEHWLNIIDLLDLRLCSISYIDDHWWSLMTYWLHNWTSFWTSWWQPGSEKMSRCPWRCAGHLSWSHVQRSGRGGHGAVTGPPHRWDTARVGGQLQSPWILVENILEVTGCLSTIYIYKLYIVYIYI